MDSLKIFEDNNDYYLTFCEGISKKTTFKEDYSLIYKIGVLYDLYSISSSEIREIIKKALIEEIIKLSNYSGIIKRLLEVAFIFANLDSEESVKYLNQDEKEKKIEEIDKLRNQAYRIAISVYYYGKFLKEIGDKENSLFDNNLIIYQLFTRLGILSKSRGFVVENDDIFSIDLHGKIEVVNKEIKNRFSIKDELQKNNNAIFTDLDGEIFQNDEVFFSDFQNNVMQSLLGYASQSGVNVGISVAISAPTSAGKTFILKKYIILKLLESILIGKKINIAFVVPSKALINELKSDFLDLYKDYHIDGNICGIHSHISGDDFMENYFGKSNLFIFTQERLNYFFNDIKYKDLGKTFIFDILVVDEAHKVSYGYRGTLLSYIISKIKQDNPILQIILLAPLLSKLYKFKKEFGLVHLHEKFSNFGLVAKNEIFVKKDKIGGKVHLRFFLGENELFKIRVLSNLIISQPSYLTYLSSNFSSSQNHNIQSIIFRYGPSAVLDQANSLYEEGMNDVALASNFYNYISYILPEDFPLKKFIFKGIGYHNGALPTSIKSNIEDLFKKGALKYLCANSTILEGVNLPAKNIFIGLDGGEDTIKNLDFKNLIGRAGRLNEHLSGNVFYVDYEEKYIEKLPNESSPTEELKNNISNILDPEVKEGEEISKFDRFLNYIKPGSKEYKVSGNDNKDFEYMLGYLVSKVIDHSLSPDLIQAREHNSKLLLLDKDYFIKLLEGYSHANKKDFIDELGDLIYSDKELKIEKIALLRSYLYSLCNNELKIRNLDNEGFLDKEFLRVVQRNIFTDPRKQLDFYDLVISGKDAFVKEYITMYSNAQSFLSSVKKKEMITSIVTEVSKYFVPRLNETAYNYSEYISGIINQWISSSSLKAILESRKDYLNTLKRIDSEIQFTYTNAFSIYFELANLGYKEYLKENHYDLYEDLFEKDDFPQLDTNFIYYLEIGTFYPNLIYLISKGVSRESAIWLKDNKIILPYLPEGISEKEYFHNNSFRILSELDNKNMGIIKEELVKFIYV